MLPENIFSRVWMQIGVDVGLGMDVDVVRMWVCVPGSNVLSVLLYVPIPI